MIFAGAWAWTTGVCVACKGLSVTTCALGVSAMSEGVGEKVLEHCKKKQDHVSMVHSKPILTPKVQMQNASQSVT